MTHLSLLLATAGLPLAILAFPAKAEALGPVDIEIGARAGVAVPGTFGPLGFGIGGRGGVSILGVYAGIEVIDYLGAIPSGAQPVQQSRSALLYGFEAGYNFKFSRVTIRPRLGLGDFRLSSAYGDPAPGNVSDVSNYFYLEPGVVGLVSLEACSSSAPTSTRSFFRRGRTPRGRSTARLVSSSDGSKCGRACARRKKPEPCTFLRFRVAKNLAPLKAGG